MTVLVFGTFVPFRFNDSMLSSWHELYKFVQNLMIHDIPAWFENLPKSILYASVEARKSDLLYKARKMVDVGNVLI